MLALGTGIDHDTVEMKRVPYLVLSHDSRHPPTEYDALGGQYRSVLTSRPAGRAARIVDLLVSGIVSSRIVPIYSRLILHVQLPYGGATGYWRPGAAPPGVALWAFPRDRLPEEEVAAWVD